MNAGTLTLGVNVTGAGLSYTPANGIVSPPARVADGLSVTVAYGTTAGKGNLICGFTIALNAGASQTINLYDGSILDVYGIAAPFRHLLAFAAWVSSGGDSAGVTIQPGAANPNSLWWGGTTPSKTVYPGGPPEVGGSPAGVVVDATHNTVKFTNNGAVAATVKVYLSGANV